MGMIQDDSREIILAKLCGLSRESSRKGIDAMLGMRPFELKSTTTDSVSTARDAGLRHVAKWRQQYWIIGKGPEADAREDWRPDELFFAHPYHLEGFFSSVEDKIRQIIAMFEEAMAIAGRKMPDDKLSAMRRIVAARAGTLNCPTIQMAYVRKHCHEVKLRRAKAHVAELVVKFPLS